MFEAPSQRMQAVQSPIIPVVADLIRAHPGTISLGQGVVHYPPPARALDVVNDLVATRSLDHTYGAVGGSDTLIDLVRRKLAAENGIRIGEEAEVVVSAGGNMAFMNAVLAVTDPGDEVVLLAPYYFNHEMAVTMAGCRPVVVPTDDAYLPDVDRIADALGARTRAVVTVSPNNPTGVIYPEDVLADINALCRARGLYHIHDEAYEYFRYAGPPVASPGSFAGASRHTISLYSLSKAYGFAAWRIGYAVVPRHLVEAVRKIQDTILICPPRISEAAAVGALTVGRSYCEGFLPALAEVRVLVLEALSALGDRVTLPDPTGAFYVPVRLHTPLDDMTVVRRLIRDHRVAVIPGGTFGVVDGCMLRIAYGALQKRTVAEAMERLVQGLGQIL